jgi:hypothetical protein
MKSDMPDCLHLSEDIDMMQEDDSDKDSVLFSSSYSSSDEDDGYEDDKNEVGHDVPPPIYFKPHQHKTSRVAFLDMQFFKGCHGSLVCKELAYATSDDMLDGCIIFDKPYPEQCLEWEQRKTNRWIAFNYHGLSWNHTGTPYSMLREVIQELLAKIKEAGYGVVYVKGEMKIRWLFHRIADGALLRTFLVPDGIDIMNLEDFNVPSLRTLREKHPKDFDSMQCDIHSDMNRLRANEKSYVCAKAHAKLMAKYSF